MRRSYKNATKETKSSAKRYARNNCDYSFKALEKIVPEALNSVSLEQIRRYARRSWRFMDAYRKGLHWSKSKKSDSDW